jgi:ACS family tartrate transporter-like MFS transporter
MAMSGSNTLEGSTTRSPAETAALRKASRRLLPFLFCLYVSAYLDRVNVGFAALQMKPALRFSDSVYGIGSGMFFVGYLFFQVPSNIALVNFVARRWLAGLMIVWGLISAGTLLVHSPGSFYLFRFLLGAAEAGFFPGVLLYLTYWFPSSARARSVALFMMAGPVSGIIGGPISGALLSLHGFGGLDGWQWLFLVEGVPAILLGMIVRFYLAEKPEDAAWLKQEERAGLLEALAREGRRTETNASSIFTSVITKPETWLLCGAYFTLTFASYGVNLWLPQVVKSFSGYTDWFVGILSVVPYVAAVAVMGFIAARSDKTQQPHWHYAAVSFAGAAALALSAHPHHVLLSTALLSVTVASIYSAFGPFWAMPRGLLSGATAPAGIAFINSIGNMGGAFGPSVVGLVKQHTGGFGTGTAVIAGALFLGGILALLARARRSSPS